MLFQEESVRGYLANEERSNWRMLCSIEKSERKGISAHAVVPPPHQQQQRPPRDVTPKTRAAGAAAFQQWSSEAATRCSPTNKETKRISTTTSTAATHSYANYFTGDGLLRPTMAATVPHSMIAGAWLDHPQQHHIAEDPAQLQPVGPSSRKYVNYYHPAFASTVSIVTSFRDRGPSSVSMKQRLETHASQPNLKVSHSSAEALVGLSLSKKVLQTYSNFVCDSFPHYTAPPISPGKETIQQPQETDPLRGSMSLEDGSGLLSPQQHYRKMSVLPTAPSKPHGYVNYMRPYSGTVHAAVTAAGVSLTSRPASGSPI